MRIAVVFLMEIIHTKNLYNMAQKIIAFAKWGLNITLGIGSLLTLNDSGNFVPNIIGIGCFALLIWLNKGDEVDM